MNLAATDPEGETIQMAVTGLPTGAMLDGTMLKWLPLYDQAGTYPLAAVYDDGPAGETTDRAFALVNQAPAEMPVVGRSVWRRLVTDNDEIAFLPAVIGDTRWKHLNLSNPGNLPLEVLAQLADDTPFGVELGEVTLPGGEEKIMRVRFVPVTIEPAEGRCAERLHRNSTTPDPLRARYVYPF